MVRDDWTRPDGARSDGECRWPRDGRAVTPVVGKTLELGLAALLIAGLVTTLYGGVVPDYRTVAGSETAERTLAGAAERVERAVPPVARAVVVDRRIPTPRTIRGRSYRIVADGERLRLVHPHPAVGAESRLLLPDRVASVRGAWQSTGTTRVVIRTTPSGLRVRLVTGENGTGGGG